MVSRRSNKYPLSSSKYLTIDGKTKTIKEWSDISGNKSDVIRGRIGLGWTAQKAVYTKKKGLTIDGETKSMKEWAEISGTKYITIYGRNKKGWIPKEAVFGKH